MPRPRGPIRSRRLPAVCGAVSVLLALSLIPSGSGGWGLAPAAPLAHAPRGSSPDFLLGPRAHGPTPHQVNPSAEVPLTWSELLPEGNPPADFGAIIVYDPLTQQTLAFGNMRGGTLASVWSFQAGVWTNVTNGTGNLTHQGLMWTSATFDTADGCLLLFGFGLPYYNAETWAYRSGTWALLTPSVEPYGTVVAGLTYDSVTSSVVLVVSGYVGGNASMITWSFHAGIWTQLPTPTHLPMLWSASMAYDNSTSDQELVLFAWGLPEGLPGNETWVYRGGDWHNVTATSGTAPSPGAATMTYDLAEQAVLLVSRGASALQFPSRTWEFSGGQWSYVATPGAAPFFGMGQQNLAFDGHDRYAVLVGESGSLYFPGPTDQTWKFDRTDLGPAPIARLNVTPQNSSLGTPVQITAQAIGGYGAIAATLLVSAPGCELEELGNGSWNCTATSGGRGNVFLGVVDQAGRYNRTSAEFNVSSPASPAPNWTPYAALGGVGIAVVLAGILLARHRRKKRPSVAAPTGPPPREGGR